LIVAVVLLLSLTWLVARGALGTRALAYFLAVLGSPVVRCRRAYAGHDLQPDGREGDVSTAGARVLVVAACGSVGNLLISAASPLGATQAE